MQMRISKKVALFIIVLSITLYGVCCIWEYFRLGSVGCLTSTWWYRWPFTLYMVPIIGIWLSWSGLWKVFNARQDWDRSVGYMKIIGGVVLIIITNLFLYMLAN